MIEVCEIPIFKTPSKEIIDILTHYKQIAIVGLSPKKDRDNNQVARYLLNAGYEIIPVNPNYTDILGLKAYPSLHKVAKKIEIVDIFRKPSDVPEIVKQAIEKHAKVIWMQEGVVNNAAAKMALDAGLKVVMNKCIMKEHKSLSR